MLSKRVKYAIKTLLFLHENGDGKPISAKIISENEKIPYKFLGQKALRRNEVRTFPGYAQLHAQQVDRQSRIDKR